MTSKTQHFTIQPSAEDRGYGFDGEAWGTDEDLVLYNADGDRLTIYAQDLAAVGDMCIRTYVRRKATKR